MVAYKIDDKRGKNNKLLGFLRATDTERDLHLHCKIYIYADGTMSLEKFMDGRVGKYEFQCSDWDYDTLHFKGRGRGRKPASTEQAMRDFVNEVQKEIESKKIDEM